MGQVCNKSFKQVRKSISAKAEKLLSFLKDNNSKLDGSWTVKQNALYEKLSYLCYSLSKEVSNLDEIHDVPDYEKVKK